MIASILMAGFLLCAFAQPPLGNASFKGIEVFTDTNGRVPCPHQHCEEMLRTGHCNNMVYFVYQSKYCRCDCSGLGRGVVQNETRGKITGRGIGEGVRNSVAGGGLPRDVMGAGVNADTGSGVLGSRLSGYGIGMNVETGIGSGIFRLGLPLHGIEDGFQAGIGNGAFGIGIPVTRGIGVDAGSGLGSEIIASGLPSNGGIGINVGSGIGNRVAGSWLPLNGISMDFGAGTTDGLVGGGLSTIGVGGHVSTGVGNGIIESRVPAISIGEVGTGIGGRRGVVQNDIPERIIEGGIGIGIGSGSVGGGLPRNVMGTGIRAGIGNVALWSRLPGNGNGVDVETGIGSGMVRPGLPFNGVGVDFRPRMSGEAVEIELPLNGGIGMVVGSGMGYGQIMSRLSSNDVIRDDIGSEISTGVAGSDLPLNGISVDFRVGAGEGLVVNGLSPIGIRGDFSSDIGDGIVGRGVSAIGNREDETGIGSREPGSGPSWNGIRGDVGDGLWSGVAGSGLPLNAMVRNVGTGIGGHGAVGSGWHSNGIGANVGLGIETAALGGMSPRSVEFEDGLLHSDTGSVVLGRRINSGIKASFLPGKVNFNPGIINIAPDISSLSPLQLNDVNEGNVRSKRRFNHFGNSITADVATDIMTSGIRGDIFRGKSAILIRGKGHVGSRRRVERIGTPTFLHTGKIFTGKKATDWTKPHFAKYYRRYYSKY